MLQLVGGPVAAAHNAAAGQAVVAQAACPHDLGAGVVIFGVIHQDQGVLFHGTQNANGDIVGHIIVFFIGKKALHGVHHNIGAAAGRLVIGQGVGERGCNPLRLPLREPLPAAPMCNRGESRTLPLGAWQRCA